MNTNDIIRQIDELDNSNLPEYERLVQKNQKINNALDIIAQARSSNYSIDELNKLSDEIVKRIIWNSYAVSYAAGLENILFPLHTNLLEKAIKTIFFVHGNDSPIILPLLKDKLLYIPESGKKEIIGRIEALESNKRSI